MDSYKNALKQDFIRVVNKFLSEMQNIEDLVLMKYNDCLSLVVEEERDFMESHGWLEVNSHFSQENLDVEFNIQETFIKEEPTMNEFVDDAQFPEEYLEGREELEYEDSTEVTFRQRRLRKRTPRVNMVLKQCKVVEDLATVWTCCFCKIVTCATYTGLRMHLLKYHPKEVEEDPQESVENQPRPPKAAKLDDSEKPERDPNWIKQMVDNSKNGILSWRCCLCSNVVSCSSFGMQLHITRMHCKKPEASADVTVETEKFDRNPTWLYEMVEKSRRGSGWKCSICLDFKTHSRNGLQAHITKMHCKKREATKFIGNESAPTVDNDSGTAVDERHERDPVWLKAVINESKAAEDLWVCKICEKLESKTFRGIQLHIIRMHCKPKQKSEAVKRDFIKTENDGNLDESDEESDGGSSEKSWPKLFHENLNDGLQFEVTENERHERDVNWIRMKINECQVDEALWQCNICESFTTKSRLGFQHHVTRKHCKPLQVQDGSSNYDSDESEDDNKAGSSKVNFKANKKSKKWAREMLRKSLNLESAGTEENKGEKICYVCKSFTCNSSRGMLLHIVRRHRSESVAHRSASVAQIKPLRPRGRPRTIFGPPQLDSKECKRKMMTANGSVDVWICPKEPCGNLVFNDENGFREHYSIKHKNNNVQETSNLASNSGLREKYEQLNDLDKKKLLIAVGQSKERVGSSNHYKCISCKAILGSYCGIRHHILTKHFRDPNFKIEETDEMREFNEVFNPDLT